MRRRIVLAAVATTEPHDPYTPPPPLRPALPAGVRPGIASGWIRGAMREIMSRRNRAAAQSRDPCPAPLYSR